MSTTLFFFSVGIVLTFFPALTNAQVTKARSATDVPNAASKTEIQATFDSATITLSDSEGEPIQNTTVRIIAENNEEIAVLNTDENGRLEVNGLLPGEYLLIASTSKGDIPTFSITYPFARDRFSLEQGLFISLSCGTVSEVTTYEHDILLAAFNGDLKDLQNAINAGSDLNTRSTSGRTPLMVALDNSEYDVALRLLELGADAGLKDKEGNTALILLSETFGEDEPKSLVILNKLINLGVNLNARGEGKTTALINAAMFEDADAVRILLTAGADPTLKDDAEETAFESTATEKTLKVFREFGINQ